jgi:hypothetical protein
MEGFKNYLVNAYSVHLLSKTEQMLCNPSRSGWRGAVGKTVARVTKKQFFSTGQGTISGHSRGVQWCYPLSHPSINKKFCFLKRLFYTKKNEKK